MTLALDKDKGLRYPDRAVVDTNVILNIALGSSDNLPPSCLQRSKGLVDDALSGKLMLILPAISLIELSSDHLLRSGLNIPKNEFHRRKRKVMEWCENADLPFADLTMNAAQWYNRTPSVQAIRALDAAILATAKFSRSSTIYTWDDRFIEYIDRAKTQDSIGVTASNPLERPIPLATR